MKPIRKILLNPGPATTTQGVKEAQIVSDICPRETEFAELTAGIQSDLKKIINADDDYVTVLNGGSGTAAMESVIASVCDKDSKALIIINGAYGERFKKIARTYNIHIVCAEYEWGSEIDFAEVEEYLKNDSNISCMIMVHHETTTGILNSIQLFSTLGEKYNKVRILDAISSYAGLPINMAATPVDFLLGTSNKCIQGMAGINFVVCNKHQLERIKNYSPRCYYLNLFDQYNYFIKNNQFRFTPPVQTMYALRKAVDEFFAEGAENRFQRYKTNYQILKNGMEALGFKFHICPGNESNILLTVYEPDDENYSFDTMHDMLYERGYTIYPGKVTSKKTFRLSILGDLHEEDIESFLNELADVLSKMNITI